MRHFTSLAVGLALALAFVQAPSSHIHAHESTGRHGGKFLHTHVPHVEPPDSEGLEWRAYDPDNDALFLNWSLTNPTDWRFTAVTLPEGHIAAPLREIGQWRRVALRPSAHAPPPFDASVPRAPPQ